MKTRINTIGYLENIEATVEEKLIILLSYVNPSEEESRLAQKLCSQISDWDEFWNLAQFNKVTPLAFENIQKTNIEASMPDSILGLIKREAHNIRLQNGDRIVEALNFLKKFSIENIPVAILKGVSFAETIYKNPFYKRMNDIDILIHFEDRKRAYKIYEELDYFYIGERISGDRDKSDNMSFLAPPYVSRNMKCIIGTQWGIKTQFGPRSIDYKGIWDRVRDLDFYGIPLRQLSPEDNLHHLCLHLGWFKLAIRDLMDLYNLLRFHGSYFNWKLFLQIIRESKTQNNVYFALYLSNRLCPIQEVKNVLEELKSQTDSVWIKGAERKSRKISILLRLYSDQVQTLEKKISSFDSVEKPGQKFKEFRQLWKELLWPQRNEVIRMAALEKKNLFQIFKARLTMPYRLLWVIANELGWLLITLLMIKTVVDLCWSCFKAPFCFKKQGSHEAYAQHIGVSLEDLKRLRDHFQ